MADRPSLFEAPKTAFRETAESRLGPVAMAALVAGLFGTAKAVVHHYDLEVFDSGLQVLTALLGAVVFTMAIILGGVMADFKEAERGMGEIVSQVRRLHWDFAFSGADAATVSELRLQLEHFIDMVLGNARHGRRWKLRDLHTPIDAMDRLLVERVQTPWPTSRTAQMGLGTLTRDIDRIEVIVETTFPQAGYLFSATAIGLVLACFLLVPLGSTGGPVLFGTISFVLVGLFLLVRAFDNPLAGSVRISLKQVEKLAAFLKQRRLGESTAAPTIVVESGASKLD
ncbi:MAG TPA: hypothetical protein VM327_05375 [Candidatus Thermoplasmatota archaeon]|nr:hypothetical protein [Candidatus Thermoplasmatota archaeon]